MQFIAALMIASLNVGQSDDSGGEHIKAVANINGVELLNCRILQLSHIIAWNGWGLFVCILAELDGNSGY